MIQSYEVLCYLSMIMLISNHSYLVYTIDVSVILSAYFLRKTHSIMTGVGDGGWVEESTQLSV